MILIIIIIIIIIIIVTCPEDRKLGIQRSTPKYQLKS